ncbi:MAG: pyridoxal 5'-phosphate synthase glutaminase subunit PdxT [Desulfovibrionaceae bacterium]|nr:pyridoxal 5'-phosphate synthase glutaminase subunit PdxT [Desulfovibrionaceae bacterium]
MARIGVLALQGAFREHIRALERCGADALPIRRPLDAGPYGGLDCLDALILPGGESTAMGRLLTDWHLLEPVRRCGLDGMPLFGTCAGLILLCRNIVTGVPEAAFCAGEPALRRPGFRPSDQPRLNLLDATVLRNAFGRQMDSFECDLEVRGVTDAPRHGLPPRPLRAVFIRAPLLLRCGADVEVLARAPGRAGESGLPVAVRQGRVLGASFHPELTGDLRLHEYFLSLVRRG